MIIVLAHDSPPCGEKIRISCLLVHVSLLLHTRYIIAIDFYKF